MKLLWFEFDKLEIVEHQMGKPVYRRESSSNLVQLKLKTSFEFKELKTN